MFKKYFKFIKCPGTTEIYILKKNRNVLDNERFTIPIKNLISINPIAIDHVSSTYVLHGIELIHLKTLDYVLKMTNLEEYYFSVVPIPLDKIGKDKNTILNKSQDEKIDFFVYQFYELYEK